MYISKFPYYYFDMIKYHDSALAYTDVDVEGLIVQIASVLIQFCDRVESGQTDN